MCKQCLSPLLFPYSGYMWMRLGLQLKKLPDQRMHLIQPWAGALEKLGAQQLRLLITKYTSFLCLLCREAAGLNQLPFDHRRGNYAEKETKTFGRLAERLPAKQQGFHHAQLGPKFRMGLFQSLGFNSLG